MELTKKDIKMTQGLAILTMVLLHLQKNMVNIPDGITSAVR